MADPGVSRVLVVDDTEGNRYATARMLRAAGLDVIEAETGAQALEIVARELPDALVLDVNLPDMTGFDVVSRMRASRAEIATPVLHLSASYTSDADRARGLEGGADAYLTHPIDPKVFVATVRSLLRAGAADRRLQEAANEWQATFDSLHDAVLLLDDHAVIRRANRVARELLERGDNDLVGQDLSELLQSLFHADGAAVADRILQGQSIDKLHARLGSHAYHVTTQTVQDRYPTRRTVCVLEDVSERFAAEREREQLLAAAEEARREAEEANQAKSEFLAVMSHELRTPLNAIGGYAQLLKLGIRGPVNEAQEADLERIRRSQLYLLSLINDVLNFARIESGHLEVDDDTVDLASIMNGMSDFVTPQLQERELAFECQLCDTGVQVRGDNEKIQQVLINLLSNALKFTPERGRITMYCSVKPETVEICVADSGRGITADKLDTIFEPFMQVDRRYNRAQEGIGLGLAISRELARAMQGDLRAESTTGEGATFVLTLRRAVG